MARTRLPPEQRRGELLELGLRVFSERAYDAISTDELAELAGISKGLLYHYFPSKRAYYAATIALAGERLLARMVPTAPPDGRPALLLAAVDGFLDFCQDNAALYRAVLRGGIGSDSEVAAIAEDVRRGAADLVRVAVGMPPPTAAVRARLYGFIGLAEALSLDWLDHRPIARPELLHLLGATLATLVDDIDPDAAAVARAAAAFARGES